LWQAFSQEKTTFSGCKTWFFACKCRFFVCKDTAKTRLTAAKRIIANAKLGFASANWSFAGRKKPGFACVGRWEPGKEWIPARIEQAFRRVSVKLLNLRHC
jgi:hypothetical protein